MFTLQGGLVGMIAGLVLTLWVGIGGQIYPPTAAKINPLPLSTAGCNNTMNQNYTTAISWTSPATLTTEPEWALFTQHKLTPSDDAITVVSKKTGLKLISPLCQCPATSRRLLVLSVLRLLLSVGHSHYNGVRPAGEHDYRWVNTSCLLQRHNQHNKCNCLLDNN